MTKKTLSNTNGTGRQFCQTHKATTQAAPLSPAVVEYALAHAEAQASGMWS